MSYRGRNVKHFVRGTKEITGNGVAPGERTGFGNRVKFREKQHKSAAAKTEGRGLGLCPFPDHR